MAGNSPAGSTGRETVLLAVIGMSPAVLTETVWALAHPGHGESPVVPDRVVVLTTLAGQSAIERDLLTPSGSDGESIWESLRSAILGSRAREDPRLILNPPVVIARPNRASGRSDALDDIRRPVDNSASADCILEEVRRLVENPDIRLIASLAGGRKTMGALLYGAMTLLGREHDRLTHVLVNEPFDDARLQPRFFFPPPTPVCHRLPAGDGSAPRSVSSADARIELAGVPFVPLRNRFLDLAELPGSFQRLVERYSRQLRSDAARRVRVEIRHGDRRLIVDGRPVRMRQKALAILHALLALQDDPDLERGQIEAEGKVTDWLAHQTTTRWKAKVGPDDMKHELSHLRTELKKAGATWFPPVRSLRFPPFQLVISRGKER